MKHLMAALSLASAFLFYTPGWGQDTFHQAGEEGVGQVGGLPSDLLPKIAQLAHILQQNIADGKLNEAQIQRELYQGDLAQVIRNLGPEASRLLDEISASLKGSDGEESLSSLLNGLTGLTADRP
jgi:hypothetical protein